MKRLVAILPLALAANAAMAQPADAPILPGYWSWSARAFGLVSLDDGTRCLKPEDIAAFIAFPGNRHYKCSYPEKSIGDGKLSMRGACVDKRGRQVPIRAEGVYTSDSFRLNINLKTLNGIPVSGVMRAKRLAAQCPLGAEGS